MHSLVHTAIYSFHCRYLNYLNVFLDHVKPIYNDDNDADGHVPRETRMTAAMSAVTAN